MIYVPDTHALLWYLQDIPTLSKRVEKIFDEAEKGEHQMFIPTIVIAEAIDLIQKKRVQYTIPQILRIVSERENYSVMPLNWEAILEFNKVNQNLEIHDRIIVATANLWSAFILTKDPEIKKYYPKKVVW